ncbi:uncharacterized protein PADG_02001 [Paracoccidioides brasiliensis Pb18]|uniref:Uncharacterized protein n=1 Tax=Paracoccidioides brasiliensis (strain Pb18) TaxID=502780 RepID=C1G4Y5_PARBD|nr:uncharacterized protein PADG_02001 [Paracoccidioides brasiliensis Pb18]EEH45851.2 hypothetical protein PADG_02001 [Paracoccidioides brasiliensis Pb18]
MELANRFPEGKTRNEVGYFEIQPLCEELPTPVMLGVFETQSIVTELVNNVSEHFQPPVVDLEPTERSRASVLSKVSEVRIWKIFTDNPTGCW